MKKVRLGKTGLEVSKVGMGGIPIQRPPLEEAVKVINRALAQGEGRIRVVRRRRRDRGELHPVRRVRKKCPYNLPIRELIQENYDFYKNMAQ